MYDSVCCLTFRRQVRHEVAVRDICFFPAFQYTVEADQQSSRSPRVRFLDNNDDKYTGKMSVNPSGDCHSLKLELVV